MKHTKGEWKVKEIGCLDIILVTEPDGIITEICRVIDYHKPYNYEQQKANAKLIAEAGTVTNETGYTPRQLAEQKANLLKVLDEILESGANMQIQEIIKKATE